MPALTTVDLAYFDTAPVRLVESIELDATAERVFDVFADAPGWTAWFPGMTTAEWTSAEPHGVGSTRKVVVRGMHVDERFIAFEPGKRFAFLAIHSSSGLLKALAEDYALEDLGGGRCRLTWAFCYTPSLPARLLGPFIRVVMQKSLRDACKSLSKHLAGG